MTVADARFAKPIDAGLVAQLAAEHDLLVTVEEGVLAGGFGSAVWETLNEAGTPVPRIMRVGLPDRYVTHGKPALLHEEVGFTGERIAERVAAAVGLGARGARAARGHDHRRVGAPRRVAPAAARRATARPTADRGLTETTRRGSGPSRETTRRGEPAVSGRRDSGEMCREPSLRIKSNVAHAIGADLCDIAHSTASRPCSPAAE